MPTVLSRAEVQAVLHEMSSFHLLMARLLYGSGMRLMECVRLRVKDLDFEYRQVTVRDAKEAHDHYSHARQPGRTIARSSDPGQ